MMSTIEDLSQTNAGNTPSASVTSTTAQDVSTYCGGEGGGGYLVQTGEANVNCS